MNFWQIFLIINIVLGLLAFTMNAKIQGELYLRDLVPGVFIILFGSLTFWFYFYEVYQKPLHKFLLRAGKLGSVRLWRSRSKITEEVLYGNPMEDE